MYNNVSKFVKTNYTILNGGSNKHLPSLVKTSMIVVAKGQHCKTTFSFFDDPTGKGSYQLYQKEFGPE
jgi:hypothetical protein